MRGFEWTVIMLGRPGRRSRQWRVTWLLPFGIVAFFVLSAVSALYAGQTARAWVGDTMADRIVAMPSELEVFGNRMEQELWRTQFAPTDLASGAADSRSLRRALLPWIIERRALEPLKLYDVNTRASLAVRPFDELGRPNHEAFSSLRRFLRCRRTGQDIEMSPALISLLTRISKHFGDPVLEIISAHRAVDGVVTSQRSQHARGTAADIRITRVPIETLQHAAYEAGATGIGLYPGHRFVHVDVRQKPYYWRETSTGIEPVRIEL